ncbi:MAG TPA: hypothetical protein VH105_08410 [Burkholderiales bacterium]|jgi:hypothetical protein|nr:hypothetical protein [Burkholderiales bacterium]
MFNFSRALNPRLALAGVVACLLVMFLPAAHAQMRSAKRCEDIDVRVAAVDSTCRTKQGGEFQRYRNPTSGSLGWRDLQSGGHIWYDAVKINAAQVEADAWCGKQPGQRVPALEDYELADSHGFIELVGAIVAKIDKPLLYSSKIAQMAVGDRAIGFALFTGDYHGVPADQKFDNAVIICVSLSTSAPSIGDDLKLPAAPK